MSKTFFIDSRIHNDEWFYNLSPQHKYLFIWIITNEFCNLIGVYEIPLTVIATYIGSTPQKTEQLIKELNPKVIYSSGWVIVPNYPKWNPVKNPSVEKGREKLLNQLPRKITDCLQGVHTLPTPNKVKVKVKVKEKVIEKTKNFSKINDITETVMDDIAKEYEIPYSLVKERYEDMKLYVDAKGKTYKNYKAALMNWLRRDGIGTGYEPPPRNSINLLKALEGRIEE